ncbi:MAG: hypothetical protein K2M15_09920, partial [Oscillospiraceae bacterium]|nr:hypothetical protein [Oscillospiraceae bacterium]
NAAALDTRVKATVASTMYDMSRVNAQGYTTFQYSESKLGKHSKLVQIRSVWRSEKRRSLRSCSSTVTNGEIPIL